MKKLIKCNSYNLLSNSKRLAKTFQPYSPREGGGGKGGTLCPQHIL